MEKPFFIWGESHTTGIQEIDADHKRLTDILNRLFNGVWDESNSIPRAFKEFAVYMKEHFAHEEGLMKWHDFPEYEKHKKDHEWCLRKAAEFQERIDHGEKLSPIEICNFFKGWINSHMMGMDRHYIDFFKDRGVK